MLARDQKCSNGEESSWHWRHNCMQVRKYTIQRFLLYEGIVRIWNVSLGDVSSHPPSQGKYCSSAAALLVSLYRGLFISTIYMTSYLAKEEFNEGLLSKDKWIAKTLEICEENFETIVLLGKPECPAWNSVHYLIKEGSHILLSWARLMFIKGYVKKRQCKRIDPEGVYEIQHSGIILAKQLIESSPSMIQNHHVDSNTKENIPSFSNIPFSAPQEGNLLTLRKWLFNMST